MFKNFQAFDPVRYLIVVPLLMVLLYQYVKAKDPVFFYLFIAVAAVCLLVEGLGRILPGRNKTDPSRQDIAGELHKKQDEILLLKNQLNLINSEFRNSIENISKMHKELNLKNEEQDAMREASTVISSSFDIKAIVEHVYKVFNKFTGCDRYLICFVDRDHNRLICRYEYGSYVFGEVGKVMGEDSTTITSCFKSRQTVVRINVPLRHTGEMGDKAAFPLKFSNETDGVIYIESVNAGSFLNINLGFLESMANYAAVAIKNAELFNDVYSSKQEIEALYEETAAVNEELSSYVGDLNVAKEELKLKNEEMVRFNDEIQMGYLQTVMALANSIEAKDPYTRGHCQRVMEISCEIAKQMGFKETEIEDLRYAAILHDIGKIGIPASILNKVGKLSEEEFNEIKKHPFIAYNILKDVNFLKNGLDAILQHHERYDGGGYPYGLNSVQIGIFGKILCVADAFDAMTSDRPYRKGFSIETALEEIRRCKGTQFDPLVADVLIELSEGL